jgi:FkbM family methyltransferase
MPIGIRNLLKSTGLYKSFRNHRQLKKELNRFEQWTEFDERMMAFYRQFIQPGDLVFDVGANMGNRTKVFCKLGARVVAFEPQLICYNFLRKVFRNTESVRIIKRALGAAEGIAEMLVSDVHTISSLSAGWVHEVTKSGRFNAYAWDNRQRVEITTLDKAILDFGVPSFAKIDVEGYEFEVLSGLSTPIDCISIEFVPECIQKTFDCIDHMRSLSEIDARLSIGESMEFQTRSWVSADEIKQVLVDTGLFGDIYIRRRETGS